MINTYTPDVGKKYVYKDLAIFFPNNTLQAAVCNVLPRVPQLPDCLTLRLAKPEVATERSSRGGGGLPCRGKAWA